MRSTWRFPAQATGRRPLLPLLLGFGLAASVLLAIGLGLKNQELTRDLHARDSVLAVRETRLAERERTLNSILEPGVELTLLTATGPQQPGVQLFRDRERNTAIIHAFRLRPAPAGRAYQLWIIPKGGGNPIPSRVFNSEPDGHALVEGVEVPAGIAIEMYAVTEEPDGGSPQPTSAPFPRWQGWSLTVEDGRRRSKAVEGSRSWSWFLFPTVFDHLRPSSTIFDHLRPSSTVFDHSTIFDRLRPSSTVFDLSPVVIVDRSSIRPIDLRYIPVVIAEAALAGPLLIQ